MSWWQARTGATYPEGQLMTSLLRTGQEKVRSTFGKGTEYLFHEPFRNRPPVARDRFLKPPSGTLGGLEWETQTTQSAIIGLPVSYRTYRRDTPPSLDRGTRPSEGDRVGRTELVHSRVPPGRISDHTRNLDLGVSFLQARTRYGI